MESKWILIFILGFSVLLTIIIFIQQPIPVISPDNNITKHTETWFGDEIQLENKFRSLLGQDRAKCVMEYLKQNYSKPQAEEIYTRLAGGITLPENISKICGKNL